MLKKLLPYLAAIIIAIGIYIGGFYSGIHIFGLMKSTTLLQDEFIKSTELMSLLNYYEKKDTEKARQYLLLQIDTAVLGIDNLSEYADDNSYRTGCNILKRIAKQRKDRPDLYASYIYEIEDNNSAAIRKEIAKILNKWDSIESCIKK
jgi:hypothetical protein